MSGFSNVKMSCFTALGVQIDGSDHRWFEDRAKPCMLLVFIDDATKKIRTVILAALKDSSGSLPQVTDLFYVERVEFLMETGELEIAQDAEEFMNIRIVRSKTEMI